MVQQKPNIILTRQAEENMPLAEKLQHAGIAFYVFSCIEITPKKLPPEDTALLKRAATFDWIVFTSKNAFTYFFDAISNVKVDTHILPHIAAVGPATATRIKETGLAVSFMPPEASSRTLAENLPNIADKKILWPHSARASKSFAARLHSRGAKVETLTLYSVDIRRDRDLLFEKELEDKMYTHVVFASPSAVKGFCRRVEALDTLTYTQLTALCIGRRTAQTASNFGFPTIVRMQTFSAEEIVKLLHST